jgi:hypothetical protein
VENSFNEGLSDSFFFSDVVAAVAFGIDGESFTNPNADFRRMGDEIFKVICSILIEIRESNLF